MKKVLEILEVETRKSKAGKPYTVAQCVLHGEKIRVIAHSIPIANPSKPPRVNK